MSETFIKSTLYPFSIVLLIISNDMFLNSKRYYIKLVKYVLKVIIILVALRIYSFCIQQTLIYTGKQLIYVVSLMIKTTIILFGLIYFEIKCLKIEKTIVDIIRCLSDRDRKRLKLYSTIMTILWLMFVIISLISAFTYFIYCRIISFYIFYDVFFSLQYYGFIIATNLLLIHTCYAVYLMEKSLLITAINHINYEDFKQHLLNIERHKDSINESLGIFPFLWFCELFSTTCLRLCYFVINKLSVQQIYIGLAVGMIEPICIFIINISCVLAINYYQTHRPTVLQLMSCVDNTLSKTLMTDRKLLSRIILKDCIHSYANCEYKAFNVFTINMKFLFTFLGSVITFAVMLIQLLNT